MLATKRRPLQFFLGNIRRRLPTGITLNLFEGFWSWIDKPKDHHIVTKHLNEGRREFIVKLPTDEGTQYQTALNLLGDNSPIPAEPIGDPSH